MDSWALIFPGALFGAVILLAALPVDLGFAVTLEGGQGKLRRSATLRWAFGLVSADLKKPRNPRDSPPKKGKGTRSADLPRIRLARLLTSPTARHWIHRFLKRLVHTIHWRRFRLNARFAFDDPADTGFIWGLISPALAALTPPQPATISIQPLFDDSDTGFQSEGVIRVFPLAVIWLLLSTAASPSTWRALWPLLRKR